MIGKDSNDKNTAMSANIVNILKSQSARTSKPESLFKNKLIPNLYPVPKKPKEPQNPFIVYSPLPTSRVVQNEQTKSGFIDYLNGQLNEEELMYIRNFPTLYENLPEPRRYYLKLYIREAKGQHNDKDDIQTDSECDNDDDYEDDDSLAISSILRIKSEQSQKSSGMKEIQGGFDAKQSNLQEQTSRIQNNNKNSINGFMTPNNNNSSNTLLRNMFGKDANIEDIQTSSTLRNVNLKKQEQQQQLTSKPSLQKQRFPSNVSNLSLQILSEQPKSIKNSQQEKSTTKKTVVFSESTEEQLFSKQSCLSTEPTETRISTLPSQDELPKSISRQLLSRKSIVMDKVNEMQTHRLASMKSMQTQLALKIHNKVKQEHISKSIGKLKGIIKNNVALRKGGTQLADITSEKKENTKFFSSFASIHSHYTQQIANKDLLSAETQSKFYNRGGYSNKSLKNLSIITQRSQEDKPVDSNKQIQDEYTTFKPLYKRYFSENANSFIQSIQDPYDPKLRSKIMKSDSEYSKFVQSYLKKVQLTKEKETFSKTGSIIKQVNLKEQFTFEGRDFLTLNTEQLTQEKSYINQIGDLDNFQDKYMIDSLSKLSQGQKVIPEKKLSNFQSRLMKIKQMDSERRKAQSVTGQNRDSINITTNQIDRTLSDRQGSKQTQRTFSISDSQFLRKESVDKEAQEKQKKLDTQQKNGYHIIKRNISDQTTGADLVHDEESDDSSNASRTEATLDGLYSESISIQSKLIQENNQEGIIKKLKQLIKLENLKKNLMDANLYKLSHNQ